MKGFVIILACVCAAQAGPAKKSVHLHDQAADGYEYEYAHAGPALGGIETHYVDIGAVSHGSHRSAPQPGFSVGGALASIAKGAADQAHTQLSQQHSAAGQAAFTAKNTLAQAANQAAATAAAAYTGKQILLMGLEQQSRDAHVAVDNEKLQLQQAQRAASAAQNSAHQAMHQVQVLNAALNSAQATADHAAQAAAEAAAELAAQTTMLGQAKARAENIDDQLTSTRLDFETTQVAAQKAANAAQAAQSNAAAAAAHAASSAAASVGHGGHGGHGGHVGLSIGHGGHHVALQAADHLANTLPLDAYDLAQKGYHY